MSRYCRRPLLFSIVLLIVLFIYTAKITGAQTTAFHYQGRLIDAGSPANGNYEMQCKLFAALTGSGQIGTTITATVAVSNGIFSVALDFSASAFDGNARYLEIGVRPAGSPNPFTVLAPRQPVTSTPYAIRSANAASADGLSPACADCVTDAQIAAVDGAKITGSIAGSQISGVIPTASVPTGSGNYIQNAATLLRLGKNSLQQEAAFDIGGDGTVGGTLSGSIVNAVTQFNLGGIRILSNAGQRNLFAGESAGQSNSGDGSNAFFGYHAGMNNTTGVRNNFFGSVAGENTSTGSDNNFFGDSAGRFNTGGFHNSFFGSFAGQLNTGGIRNSFFGYQAGQNNGVAINNSMYGARAGINNTGGGNTFVGEDAGFSNTAGSVNTFIGAEAGALNTTGNNNIAIGNKSDFAVGNLNYATVIGTDAVVSTSNTIVLGRQINQTSADSVGIGIPNPARTLDVSGRARVRSIPLEVSGAAVCFNALGDLLQCGASSLRFKQNVKPFSDGLNLLRQLRPISFTWKEGGGFDIGLAAEEVAEVAPFFTIRNERGGISGVKYERLNMLFINAINEQQAQLETQKQTIKQQQAQIERQQVQIEKQQHLIERQQQQLSALLTFLCKQHPQAEMCQ